MPKVELHAHLNGSIRDSTLLELTKALGEKGVINFSQVEHIIMKFDERCDMELDETDPTVWMKLESAVDEYIQKNYLAFENLS